jgi:hypothetical protein
MLWAISLRIIAKAHGDINTLAAIANCAKLKITQAIFSEKKAVLVSIAIIIEKPQA